MLTCLSNVVRRLLSWFQTIGLAASDSFIIGCFFVVIFGSWIAAVAFRFVFEILHLRWVGGEGCGYGMGSAADHDESQQEIFESWVIVTSIDVTQSV